MEKPHLVLGATCRHIKSLTRRLNCESADSFIGCGDHAQEDNVPLITLERVSVTADQPPLLDDLRLHSFEELVFDELSLRRKLAEYKTEFNRHYPGVTVLYAAKAFMNRAMALLVKDERMGMDVVSGGEMGIALSVGFPMEKIFFHGNNKSAEELTQALECGVGRIVVDNFHELRMLDRIAGEKKCKPE